MAATKAPYRIWFRGKFPKVVAQYVDHEFPDAEAAESWAINELRTRNARADNGDRFNRITVHVIANGKVADTPVREVMFGA